jgi:hypothetical protein
VTRWRGPTASGTGPTACEATLARCAADRARGLDGTRDAHHTLNTAAEAGLRAQVPDALDLVAGCVLDRGRASLTARLHAAAERLRSELGIGRSPLARYVRSADEPAQTASSRRRRTRTTIMSAAGSRSAGLTVVITSPCTLW